MVLTVLAGADYIYQRLAMLRSLRMSRREMKDEMKQAEGDPLVRARLRQIRTERARRRMMAAVPGASVVITNPTHFAVALKYEMGETGAPRVVAKGADLSPSASATVAEENGVPVVENPAARARALRGRGSGLRDSARALQGGGRNYRLRVPPQGQNPTALRGQYARLG